MGRCFATSHTAMKDCSWRILTLRQLLDSSRRGASMSRGSTASGVSRRITMAKTDFKSVDEYIASQPKAARVVLDRVRSTIRKAVPKAEEVISYQMPTYNMHGDRLIFFA